MLFLGVVLFLISVGQARRVAQYSSSSLVFFLGTIPSSLASYPPLFPTLLQTQAYQIHGEWTTVTHDIAREWPDQLSELFCAEFRQTRQRRLQVTVKLSLKGVYLTEGRI